MEEIALFEGYSPKRTWIDRVDPRLKLVWATLVITLALLHSNYILISVLLGLVIGISLLAGTPVRSFYGPLLLWGIIGLQLLLIQLLFCREGTILFTLGPLSIYSEALPLALIASLRLGLIMLAGMQFLQWTSPEDITILLVQVRIPYRFAMLVGLAMRFLPLMEREMKAIFEVQQARGLKMDTVGDKLKNLLPVLMPFLFRAFRRANDTALAMELRGFGYARTRTFLKGLRLGKIDAFASAGIIGLMAVVSLF